MLRCLEEATAESEKAEAGLAEAAEFQAQLDCLDREAKAAAALCHNCFDKG